MQLLLVLMKRTHKLIILAFTFGLFFVFPVSNLISVFAQVLGGTSASSVNDNNKDDNKYNNNTHTDSPTDRQYN
jgi:hypothetical protein